MTLLVGKNLFEKPPEKPVNHLYQKLKVDELPQIEKPEKLNHKVLLQEYEEKHGSSLKPVKYQKNAKYKVPRDLTCHKCSAPSSFLYVKNGQKEQYSCKVCKAFFHKKSHYQKEAILKCPHCMRTLEKGKQRKDFTVYKCRFDGCPHYQKRMNTMSAKEKRRFKKESHLFKMRYVYRQFTVDFKPLSKDSPKQPIVDLSRLYASPHTIGLILTYHVNYGLSARKTAIIMKDVHGVSISHQSVLNYVNSASLYLKPFVDNYPYDLSDQFCGDETYIRVNGKWHYLFFFFDAVKKIILSYPVSPNRDTVTAIKAMDDVLGKLKEIPEDLTFVVDGNPIYLLAQHFFAQYGISFDVQQVIGLTNEDDVSKKHRPLKQIIERLNRTFKGNYRATNGFGSDAGSVSYVTLFVAYFNFLRPHTKLEGKVPVMIPELETLPHMPARWTKLLDMSQKWILEHTT